MLSGCITAELPDLGIEIPWKYRAAPRTITMAPPKLDWWRGFRSTELTSLIEEAHAGNFDIAIAIARIVQADAASKIAGAPLLPHQRPPRPSTRSSCTSCRTVEITSPSMVRVLGRSKPNAFT